MDDASELVPLYKVKYSVIKRGKAEKYSPILQLLTDINLRLEKLGVPLEVASNYTVYCSEETWKLWVEREYKWELKVNGSFLKAKHLKQRATYSYLFNAPIFKPGLKLHYIYLNKEQAAYLDKKAVLYRG